MLIAFSTMITWGQTEWIPCQPPLDEDFLAVSMPESNKIIAGGTNGALLMSTDLGETFEIIPLEENLEVTHIQFIDPLNGFLLQDALLLRTMDGGYNWEFVSEIPGNVRGIFFVNTSMGYSAGDNGESYITTDGGQTWSLLITGTDERLMTVSFKNSSEGLFGGKDGVNLFTSDQGQTFSPAGMPAIGNISDIQWVSGTDVYSCGEEGEVLYSSDGGSDWTAQLTPDNNGDLEALHFTDPGHGAAVGAAGTIFHTFDGGQNWISDLSNTTSDLNDVHFFSSGQGMAVGNGGTILRFGDIATAVNENSDKMVPGIKVFPNPASDVFTVSLPDHAAGNTLSIYDISGREVYSRKIDMQEMRLHCSDLGLPQGVYLVKTGSDGSGGAARLLVR